MRVLNIIQCTNLGGMEQSNLLRLKGLIARGHEVEVISLTPLGEQAPQLREAGIPAVGLDYKGFLGWRSLPAMRKAFAERNPDAILMTGHNLAATLCLIGNPAKRKVQAIHYHHLEAANDHLKWRMLYRVAGGVFDEFTFCSRYIFDEATSISPHLRSKATVLPNPFAVRPASSPEQRAAARAALDLPASAVLIGNAGWLIERKRFDIFLRVAAAIAKHQPQAIFLIAGDGSDRPALESLASQLGISERVRFLGWRSDLSDFYDALDLVVFNSDFDALPRTPLEAAGAGVPVVASLPKGGLVEALRSPDEIVLFETHDVGAMADAALSLLSDPARRARMAAAARQRVVEFGSITRHADAMERLLNGAE